METLMSGKLIKTLFMLAFVAAMTTPRSLAVEQRGGCKDLSGQWTVKNETTGRPLFEDLYVFPPDVEAGPFEFMNLGGNQNTFGSGKLELSTSHEGAVTRVLDFEIVEEGQLSEDCAHLSFKSDQTVWVRRETQHVTDVHVVFMNHLDVGYNGISPITGFISNVLNVYFKSHFPRALRLQKALRSLGYKERYIYTSHPWLISMYVDCPRNLTLSGITLQCPSDAEVREFEDAIRRGDMAFHDGPFNLQIEHMDPLLFEYGLTMAADLYERYGLPRPNARVLSQRDVPGLTRSAIPLLTKNDVRAVTIGQNFGTPFVGSPDHRFNNAFMWRDEDSGEQVVGMWHPGGYGGVSHADCVISPNGHALAFGFRTDNAGPPESVQELLEMYSDIRAQFPWANVEASTYQKFIPNLLEVADSLPVVTNEIGDVWIQGIASDPLKTSVYRELSRSRTACMESGACQADDQHVKDFSRYLIKLPEHTWGLPGVNDGANWSNEQLERQRKSHNPNFENCQDAWKEQREFAKLALESLPQDHPLREYAEPRLRPLLAPPLPDTSEAIHYSLDKFEGKTFTCTAAQTSIAFDARGALSKLSAAGSQWASEQQPLALFSYATLNETDFDFMMSYYGANAGYSKVNSTCAEEGCPNPESRRWYGTATDLWVQNTDSSCHFVVKVEMPSLTHTHYGSPSTVYLEYNISAPSFRVASEEDDNSSSEFAFKSEGEELVALQLRLVWVDKTPTRLPESIFLEFRPEGEDHQGSSPLLQMDKLGEWVGPAEVLVNGSQYQHAVWRGFRWESNSRASLYVETLDAPLVSPITDESFNGWDQWTPTAMPVPTAPLKQESLRGMAVNMYNNVWDTNYIFWYPYDSTDHPNSVFRYRLSLVKSSSKTD